MDRKAVSIGAIVTTSLLLGAAYAGLNTLGLAVVVGITGFLTGAVSDNFQSEEADAALAVGIGTAVAVLLVVFGEGVLPTEQIHPALSFGVGAALFIFALLGIPVFALFGAISGRYGARARQRYAS